MRDDHENLLVIDRCLVERIGLFQGLSFATEQYLPVLLRKENYKFVPRHLAEEDPSLKQLIPYFIICHADRVWCYVRGKKSGEDRLVAKASIGIGGHINHLDENLFDDLYETAARRELEEEVGIPAGYTQRIVALLNDDSNPVGRVHLGVVHVLRTDSPAIRKREDKITEASFKTVPELKAMRERMETWSQICLDGIDTLLDRGQPEHCTRNVQCSPVGP